MDCRGPLAGLDERVRRALDLMESDNGRGRITEADLAAAACLSVSHFAHSFRRQLGMAPVQMLRLTRTRKTAALLLADDSPLKEIADAAGFRSVAHLSRLFKRLYGVSLREYRRNNRR
jgi:AraC-like DNA-binding protein